MQSSSLFLSRFKETKIYFLSVIIKYGQRNLGKIAINNDLIFKNLIKIDKRWMNNTSKNFEIENFWTNY